MRQRVTYFMAGSAVYKYLYIYKRINNTCIDEYTSNYYLAHIMFRHLKRRCGKREKKEIQGCNWSFTYFLGRFTNNPIFDWKKK